MRPRLRRTCSLEYAKDNTENDSEKAKRKMQKKERNERKNQEKNHNKIGAGSLMMNKSLRVLAERRNFSSR